MANVQPITGAVLAWAIDAAGLDTAQVSRKAGISVADLELWIDDLASPNQGQLAALSSALGRPASFFYLPRPPKTASAPQVSFRRFAGTDDETTPAALDGIRLATNVQSSAAWVRDRTQERASLPQLDVHENVELAGEKLQAWLGWSTVEQMSAAHKDYAVAKLMRTALQSRHVLVLHLSLDQHVTRGFSLWHATAPLIAINTKDPVRARLFSYAHELTHLALGETAVCEDKPSNSPTERFCNNVAGALLMPRREFLEQARAKVGSRQISTLDEVAAIRPRFKVSLRATAIRAEHLGVGIPGLYDLVNREAGEAKPSGGGGRGRTKPMVRVDEYGSEFVHTLQTAVERELLKPVQVADLLRVSVREWGEAQAYAATGGSE